MTEEIVEDTTQTTTTGNTTSVVTPGGASSGVSKTQPTTDYESAYKGLQSTYQKLKRDHDALAVTHNALVAEHEKVKQDLVALQSAHTSLEGEAKTHKAQLSRTRLIMSEFPDLGEFEKDGLLPADTEETALRPKLDAFRSKLQSRIGDGVKKQVSGTTPAVTTSTTSTSSVTEDEDYVFQQMSAVAGRDPAKFREWQAKWDLIQAAKKK